MSDPPSTISVMGDVVDLGHHRRARELRMVPGVSDGVGGRRLAGAPVERLARAVRVLDTVLTGALQAAGLDESDIRRELVALAGAVAVSRYGMATARTERLVDRLRRR